MRKHAQPGTQPRHGSGKMPGGSPYCPPFQIIIHDGLADGREWRKRNARRKLSKLAAILLTVMMTVGVAAFWWLDVGRAKREQTQAEASCLRAVNSMRSAYNRAVTEHGKLVAAFNTLDETKYDLDALEPLASETVEIPPVTDCQASPENTTATTDRLTGVYETKAREYAMSLTGAQTHGAG